MFYQLIISHLFFDYGKMVTPSMVAAKSTGRKIGPIALHASLHSLGVFAVLICNGVPFSIALLLSLFEFVTHLAIDILKGRIETKYPKLKDPKNPWTWHLFQADQFLHISVMYIISFINFSSLSNKINNLQTSGFFI